MALTFGVVALPLMLAVGTSVDYVRVYNVRDKMQADLDAGLLAAIQQVTTLDEDEIEDKIAKWFVAQTDLTTTSFSIDDIEVNKKDGTIGATVSATVPTTFMNIANITEIPVTVYSAGKGPTSAFLEVYIVIDKSPSMLLAANASDQAKLRADKAITCEFACHDNNDPVKKNGYKVANNYYDYMKSTYGAELRADVANTAANEVVDMIEEANNSNDHIRVGLYKIGDTATEVLAPSSSMPTIRKYLNGDSYGLTSATSEDASYFDKSLDKLEDFVGTAGDGSSRSKPLKLVLLLTDGLQSERNYVLWWSKPTYNPLNWQSSQSDNTKKQSWNLITPLNPNWCSGMKTNGVTVGVLYTEYLAIPADWGYNETVGKTMSSSRFTSTWGGTMASGISSSTTRRDYLPTALQNCASSETLFLSANDEDEIEEGLSSLFDQYMNTVRLTQ